MKLSPRQREFLSRLLDLYKEHAGPVHYAAVAQALDVRPVTAYEMLRLLESKGLVRAETARPTGRRGRTRVLFSPNEKAERVLNDLTGGMLADLDWERAKASVLRALEAGKGDDYQTLLNELLLRLPERTSPLLFVADMLTATILVFYDLRDRAAARRIFAHLRLFGPPGWAVLYSIAGLSLSLSLVEKANRRATSVLLSYAQQFREHLDNLTPGEKVRLSEFVSEILRVIGL